MSKFINYYSYIKSTEWRKKADEAKSRAGHRCQVCNRPQSIVTLNAHHRTYERLGNERPEDITVLCHECHELFEKQNKIVRPADDERQCEQCHKLFKPNKPFHKLCPTCAAGKSNKSSQPICDTCSKPFKPLRPTHTTCRSCYRAKRSRKPVANTAKPLPPPQTHPQHQPKSKPKRFAWFELGAAIGASIICGLLIHVLLAVTSPTQSTLPVETRIIFVTATPTATPRQVTATPTRRPTSTPRPTPTTVSRSAPAPGLTICNCNTDIYNCSDFNTQREAQTCFNYCNPRRGDIHKLDADNNGQACESLP